MAYLDYLTDPVTDQDVINSYRNKLGREPESQEAINAWKSWANKPGVGKSAFNKSFDSAAQEEITGKVTRLGTDMMSGNIPGFDMDLQTENIEEQYNTAGTELENELSERAAGGGFESGGYYASVAKGKADLKSKKITTLADMNKALAEYKVNMALTGASLLSGLQDKKITAAQYTEDLKRYNAEMADYRAALKKSQDEWWKPVVGTLLGSFAGGFGAAAGGAIGANLMKKPGEAPVAPVAPKVEPIATTSLGYYPSMKKNYFDPAYPNRVAGGNY